MRTRNSKSIKEQGEMVQTMRNHMVAAKIGEKQMASNWKERRKKHSREKHHHSHTHK